MTMRRAVIQGLAVLSLTASVLLIEGRQHAQTTLPVTRINPGSLSDRQWAFIHAACDRLPPADEQSMGVRCEKHFAGRVFAELAPAQQEALLRGVPRMP